MVVKSDAFCCKSIVLYNASFPSCIIENYLYFVDNSTPTFFFIIDYSNSTKEVVFSNSRDIVVYTQVYLDFLFNYIFIKNGFKNNYLEINRHLYTDLFRDKVLTENQEEFQKEDKYQKI